MAGRLYLIGTPIGHLGDVSDRMREVLAAVSLVAAEDTRRTGRLLKHLEIHARLTSYYDHNERRKAPFLVEALERGEDVAVVSNAGMPGIADPGWHIVQAAIERGIDITPIPGPTALILALVVSGLPAHRFAFEGYLPRKPGARRKRLAELRREERTMVFYETPHKLAAALADMAEVFGERRASLSRELTKQHEETIRGTIGHIADHIADHPPRGEYVIVVAGEASAPAANGCARAEGVGDAHDTSRSDE